MKVAALDLGTNTFLCLIGEGEKGRLTKVIRDEVEIVRLGQGVDATGEFHVDALARARACLTRFRAVIDSEKVDRVLGVATSAARDAKNGMELFRIGDELDLPFETISGDQEARFSYAGACSEIEPTDEHIRLVVDVGGGSTEVIVGRGQNLLFAHSLDIGAVRLTERWIPQQPVTPEARQKLEAAIQSELKKVIPDLLKHSLQEIRAVAGTPTSLAAIELGGFDAAKVEGYSLPQSRLDFWCDELASHSVEEKKRRYQLGGRADIIFSGVMILRELVRALGQPGLRVSAKGLRYGLALDLLRRG